MVEELSGIRGKCRGIETAQPQHGSPEKVLSADLQMKRMRSFLLIGRLRNDSAKICVHLRMNVIPDKRTYRTQPAKLSDLGLFVGRSFRVKDLPGPDPASS
jgi:hypothetical protein